METEPKLLYVVSTKETRNSAGLEHILKVARITPAELTELEEAVQRRKEAKEMYLGKRREYWEQVPARFQRHTFPGDRPMPEEWKSTGLNGIYDRIQERWHNLLVARYERKNPEVKTLIDAVEAARQERVNAWEKETEVQGRIDAQVEVYKIDIRIGDRGVADKIPAGYVRVEKK